MMHLATASEPLRILMIEDSKGDAMLIDKALRQSMPETHSTLGARTLEEAMSLLEDNEFDVALLDRSLPDCEGFEGLHRIQNMAPRLPVIFLTAYKDEQTAFGAIEQGAQDYLFKDTIDGHAIRRSIQYSIMRKQFEGVLIMRANFDMLTGLANRTLFESRLDMALARMKRHGGKLGALVLDLNDFKGINDTFGHATGDKLLKDVGKRLKESLRPYDTAARLGGDEFAVLLENMPEFNHAETVAKKIAKLFTMPFQVADAAATIGISIGIATCSQNRMLSAETLMQQADRAMYKAKSSPGHSYQIFDELEEPARAASM